jgi:hypothetical protein
MLNDVTQITGITLDMPAVIAANKTIIRYHCHRQAFSLFYTSNNLAFTKTYN